MDIEQINDWKAKVEKEVEHLADQLKTINFELARKREQLDLLAKLLESETDMKNGASRSAEDGGRRGSFAASPSPTEVKDRVLEILTEANRPMNIKEIHAEFIRKGLSIPGKGTPFNILIHVSREVRKGNVSRFYRTGKGTYAVRQKARAH